MYEELTEKAITCALDGNWQEALTLNLKLLKQDPNNVSTLNRCARAHLETGNVKRAKECAKKVLKIDPANSIACKCLERWMDLSDHLETVNSGFCNKVAKEFFIETPGKTKVIALIRLGSAETINLLNNADIVCFKAYEHKVCVVTSSEEKYIGSFPDNIAAKLHDEIENYLGAIRSVGRNSVKVFLRKTD